MIDPEAPFREPVLVRSLPRAMREPPPMPRSVGRLAKKTALLINPFYPKDPHASFGKHVLTPTLALTSVAGATPEGWDVSYFDENLLHGPAPRWRRFRRSPTGDRSRCRPPR